MYAASRRCSIRTRSATLVPRRARSATLTARSICGLPPSACGFAFQIFLSNTKNTGRLQARSTSDLADSAFRPPTAIPPIVAPVAIGGSVWVALGAAAAIVMAVTGISARKRVMSRFYEDSV